MVKVKAYGKINLTLEVLGLRSDGYHEIRSIMQNIQLHDTLNIESSSDGQIHISGNNEHLKYDDANLIYKAATALKLHSKSTLGANIYLDKVIPLEAGLAGGSADAAATLTGLNKVWNLNLTINELIEIGAKIGSDIPFCLVGDTALVEGRGEKVTSLKSPFMEKLLIVKPDFGASTKQIYQKFDDIGEINSHNHTDLMIQEIKNQGNYKKFLYNDLEKVTTKLYPEVQEILDTIRKTCKTGMMSGSGPTCFAIGDDDSINILYDKFQKKYKDVFITSLKQ